MLLTGEAIDQTEEIYSDASSIPSPLLALPISEPFERDHSCAEHSISTAVVETVRVGLVLNNVRSLQERYLRHVAEGVVGRVASHPWIVVRPNGSGAIIS